MSRRNLWEGKSRSALRKTGKLGTSVPSFLSFLNWTRLTPAKPSDDLEDGKLECLDGFHPSSSRLSALMSPLSQPSWVVRCTVELAGGGAFERLELSVAAGCGRAGGESLELLARQRLKSARSLQALLQAIE